MAERTHSTDAAGSVDPLERDHGFSSALLDVLGALVCVIDHEGRIFRFNRTCERLSGYTIDEVRQRPFWELLVPNDEVEGVKEVVRYLVKERRPNQWENHWITKTGERRLICWSNTVLCNDGGHLDYILGTGIDITERRRAEEERDRLLVDERRERETAVQAEGRATFLAEAGRVLSDAFEDPGHLLSKLAGLAVPYLASWCAIRIVGEHGIVTTPVFIHVDPKKQARPAKLGARVFTLPAMQALPAALVEGRSLLINGGASCLEHFSAAFPNLKGAIRTQAAAILRNAGIASLMMVPLGARGRLFGAMLFVSADERCHYGPTQLVLAEALAARAAIALDNARLYRDAQWALQAREDFLVIASHELKTPLTSLQLAVQALLRRTRVASAGEAAPCSTPLLAAVERSTARLGTLVDDLLDISHFTSDPPVPALQEVNLRAVVADAVERSADVLLRAGCVVSQTVAGPTDGRWDRGWLVRIVGQLLSNAARYGGGLPIEIGLHGGERAVELTVRDHGIGISARAQARIFERFERGAPVQHYGGFGLGLWLVRRLVETLGGAIRVESRVGEGATFTVELPRCGPEASRSCPVSGA